MFINTNSLSSQFLKIKSYILYNNFLLIYQFKILEALKS